MQRRHLRGLDDLDRRKYGWEAMGMRSRSYHVVLESPAMAPLLR